MDQISLKIHQDWKIKEKKVVNFIQICKGKLGKFNQPKTPVHFYAVYWQGRELPLHGLFVLLNNFFLSNAGIYNCNISFSKILRVFLQDSQSVYMRNLTQSSWIFFVEKIYSM